MHLLYRRGLLTQEAFRHYDNQCIKMPVWRNPPKADKLADLVALGDRARPAKGGQAQNRVPQGLWVQVPPPALQLKVFTLYFMINIYIKADSRRDGEKWISDGMVHFLSESNLTEHREFFNCPKFNTKKEADKYFIQLCKKKYKIKS